MVKPVGQSCPICLMPGTAWNPCFQFLKAHFQPWCNAVVCFCFETDLLLHDVLWLDIYFYRLVFSSGKFIAHSKLRAAFSLCLIALLNSRNEYWFFIFDLCQWHTTRWVWWRIETMVLPELSRTMAYTTRKTVNILARKQLYLNHVVSERPNQE